MMDSDRDQRTPDNPQSTAKIGGHPIHPMLIPFPIVCFVGALVTDIVYLNNGIAGWAEASHWLLGVGIVMAALAAIAGLTDFMGDDRIRRLGDATKHMIANVAVVVLEIVNFVLRLGSNDSVGNVGVYLSAVSVLLLLYSGWKGGELVFVHRVGVQDQTRLM